MASFPNIPPISNPPNIYTLIHFPLFVCVWIYIEREGEGGRGSERSERVEFSKKTGNNI